MQDIRKYLYEYNNGQKKPYGVIVATENGIGISVCHPKDDFNKDLGVNIAKTRISNKKPFTLPLDKHKIRIAYQGNVKIISKQSDIQENLERMTDRATKYFKKKIIPIKTETPVFTK